MATPSKRKIVRSTNVQIKRLVEYMAANPLFAVGEFSCSLGGQQMDAEWAQLQGLLAKIGPLKSVQQWKHTWRDLKKKARDEVARARMARVQTGNATLVPEPSALSQQILSIIGRECAVGLSVEGETGVGEQDIPCAESSPRPGGSGSQAQAATQGTPPRAKHRRGRLPARAQDAATKPTLQFIDGQKQQTLHLMENPASNLLAYEVSKKKWLCKEGEASCSVVLQLKHAVQISTVHIGAYHAALVEVLVGRSETPNDQFEVLVPSSVFLSPMDSRRGTGVERVRSFSAEQLTPAKAQNWDRVRVVCSQPYNKHCKYGLSFVHIFESDKSESDKPPSPQAVPAPVIPTRVTLPIGQYSSDEDDFKPGELFTKHRLSEGSKNTEAQIRQASSQALRNINDSATKLVKTPIAKTNTNRTNQTHDFNTSRQKDNIMYTDDDEQPHAKIDSVVKRHKDEKEQQTKKKEAVQNPFRKDKEKSNILEQASKNFKEFLDDKHDKKNSSTSRSKDTKENDGRNKESNNSTTKDSSRYDDRRNKDLSNSRSQESSKDRKRNTDDLNSSRNKDSSRDNDRRNRDDANILQSRTKDAGTSGDNRKRQHADDRQKGDVLRPGPVSSTPHTLMSGVVFALSGYENPRRARLRDSAVAMGARFERDWNPTCTHLICAFPNTPKLRTVRSFPSGANCIVVLGEWIEQCCEKRRLFPWQWFATESKKKVQPPAGWDEDDKSASECDTDDEIEKVLRKQKKQRTDKSPSPQPTTSRDSPQPHSSKDLSPRPQTSRDISPKPHSSRQMSPKPHSSRDKSPKQSSSKENSRKRSRERSDKESPKQKRNLNHSNISSESDVAFVKDERIQANITIDSGDSTDEEKPVVKEKIDKSRVLPDFFDGYTFVIDDCVESAGFDKELLSRYVKAYGGIVMDASAMDSDSDISFVLSVGTGSSQNGLRVRADWLWRCHEDKQLADVEQYKI